MEINKFGREGITYEGIGATKKWERFDTYAKLVENIVQGIARDLLAESMLVAAKAGYEIVMHIHDEIVIEAPNNGNLDILRIYFMKPLSTLPIGISGKRKLPDARRSVEPTAGTVFSHQEWYAAIAAVSSVKKCGTQTMLIAR